MKLLYLMAHAVLEYDEVRLFSDRGIAVFSPGFYLDPHRPKAPVRPPVTSAIAVEGALDSWVNNNLTIETCLSCAPFVNLFDVIVLVHRADLLVNIDVKGLPPIIVRTIGQNLSAAENVLRMVRSKACIVRYSPLEQTLPTYAGHDRIIRFAKYKSDFKVCTGEDKTVLSFFQSAGRRLHHCNYDFYNLATRAFPRVLYGAGNPPSDFSRPAVSYEEMLGLYAKHAAYFCLGTIPAGYTLNLIEAMFSGTPVVVPGRKVIGCSNVPEPGACAALYEAPDLLCDAPSEMVADSVIDARRHLDRFLKDEAEVKSSGEWLRVRAEQLFSSDRIGNQWGDLFDAVM
jgi:hypothetical protein